MLLDHRVRREDMASAVHLALRALLVSVFVSRNYKISEDDTNAAKIDRAHTMKKTYFVIAIGPPGEQGIQGVRGAPGEVGQQGERGEVLLLYTLL